VKCEPREERGETHSSGYDDVRYIIENYLKLDSERFEHMEYGRHGYRYGVAFNGIEIYYGGNSLNMGVNVSMSGNGCRTYAQFHPMEELLQRIYDGVQEGEINPTRLDIACDDYDGHLELQRIIEYIRDKRLRARSTHRKGIFNLDRADGDEGDTVYIGSEKSERRTRIYDKAKEQGDYKGVWNRLEMVNRRQYARAVLEALIINLANGMELGEIVAGMLADQLAFIERDDVNISRCSLASWWAEFLENLTRIKLMLKEKPELAIEKLAMYVGDYWAPTIVMLYRIYGEAWLDTVIEQGAKKLRKRHLTMMNNYSAATSA
jgi:phage replication initiation protein